MNIHEHSAGLGYVGNKQVFAIMAASYGGYDYCFADKSPAEKFTCNTICTKVLRDPHITKCCGQHFCESCLNYWFTRDNKKSCPHCRAEGEEFQHFLDKRLKREIDSLRIHCTHKEEGCRWVGELEALKDHLEPPVNGCLYFEVECPNKCMHFFGIKVVKVKRKDLENHLTSECYLRPYRCEHCGHNDTYAAITGHGKGWIPFGQHYDSCPEFPVDCPNKCGAKGLKRKDMEGHRKQCLEEMVECPYKCKPQCWSVFRFGKESFKSMMKRKDLGKHLKEECELRPYHCEYCKLKDTYRAIAAHCATCPEFPVECPNNCGLKSSRRRSMEQHQCPEEKVKCPFEEAGCNASLVRRELEQHLATSQQQHLLMVMGAYKELKLAYTEMQKANAEMKSELQAEQRQIKDDHQIKIATLSTKLDQLQVVSPRGTKSSTASSVKKKPLATSTSGFSLPSRPAKLPTGTSSASTTSVSTQRITKLSKGGAPR